MRSKEEVIKQAERATGKEAWSTIVHECAVRMYVDLLYLLLPCSHAGSMGDALQDEE